MRLPALLTHVQRDRLIKRIHRVRIKRLLFGAVLIGLGSMMPEWRGHEIIHAVSADTLKGFGYIPVLKLFEDIMS